MIPYDFITEWRQIAPWVQDQHVEQDIILSRALIEIFSSTKLADALAFRGGTALHKLYLPPATRYSEDIDLVQLQAGPIGEIVNPMREILDPWLGRAKWKQGRGRFTLSYRFNSTSEPVVRMRLKIEINTREHFNVYGLEAQRFEMDSRWFSGAAPITTYALDELLGTKLRALYQRKKGRDLFDLWSAGNRAQVDPDRVAQCFLRYLSHEDITVSRAEFERNFAEKLADPRFAEDIRPLLSPDAAWDKEAAARYIENSMATRLPGHPWKGGSEE